VESLDRESKQMLGYITNPKNMPNGHMMYSTFYEAYCKSTGLSENRAMSCIRHLTDEGYVRSGGHFFELEHKAYQRHAFARQAVYAFLAKSIVVPIVVTILTLIVINLAKDVLPQWLSRLLVQW